MSALPNQLKLDDWEPLQSSQDIEKLMTGFGGFADAIFISHQSWSECYIDEDLSIVYPAPGYSADQKGTAIFQRQSAERKTIELLFLGIKRIQMSGRDADHDGIINFADITIHKNGERSFIAKSSPEPNADGIYFAQADAIYWRLL